jgi:hypothetical protein
MRILGRRKTDGRVACVCALCVCNAQRGADDVKTRLRVLGLKLTRGGGREKALHVVVLLD